MMPKHWSLILLTSAVLLPLSYGYGLLLNNPMQGRQTLPGLALQSAQAPNLNGLLQNLLQQRNPPQQRNFMDFGRTMFDQSMNSGQGVQTGRPLSSPAGMGMSSGGNQDLEQLLQSIIQPEPSQQNFGGNGIRGDLMMQLLEQLQNQQQSNNPWNNRGGFSNGGMDRMDLASMLGNGGGFSNNGNGGMDLRSMLGNGGGFSGTGNGQVDLRSMIGNSGNGAGGMDLNSLLANGGSGNSNSPNIDLLARLLQAKQNSQQSFNRMAMDSSFGNSQSMGQNPLQQLLNPQQMQPQKDLLGTLLSNRFPQNNNDNLMGGMAVGNGRNGNNPLLSLLNQNRPMNQGSVGPNLASLLSARPGSGNAMWNDNSANLLNPLLGGKKRQRRNSLCYKCKK